MNGCVAELERLLLTGKSQMRVTEPFRGNWARAETVDGSYKLTDWTHAIRTVQTQVKSTVLLFPNKELSWVFGLRALLQRFCKTLYRGLLREY